MNTTKLSIVVSGMIAADPFHGGATWAVLQYLLGLRELGHRVLLIEPLPESSLQPQGSSLSDSLNANYFRQIVAQFGLQDDAALLLAGTHSTVGLDYEHLRRRTADADLLLNISGMLTNETLLSPIPVRAYLDLDPAFIQLWQAQGIDMRFGPHTHFVTIGHNIGTPICPVPTCGKTWVKTFQPIVLKHWPLALAAPAYGLTTIANWRGYGSVELAGVHYGQKAHSFRQFMKLPLQTSEPFQVALAIHPHETVDIAALDQNAWQRLDPKEVAGTPDLYQRFIQSSKGEIGIAKSGYALSQCGWFSDRSVCYLASGRPVITQDTGLEKLLPTGAGLFLFRTTDDVIQAIDSLNSRYEEHRRLARQLAEEYFDSSRVLPQLLEKLGTT